MGKLTISTGPFSIAMLVYQRVKHTSGSGTLWGWGGDLGRDHQKDIIWFLKWAMPHATVASAHLLPSGELT